MKKIMLVIVALLSTHVIHSITLVYSMKIRRAAQLPAEVIGNKKVSWLLTALPIMYERSRHIVDAALKQDICENSQVGGAVFNLRILAPHLWWVELTTGLENQTSRLTGTQDFTMSRTGLDDIVVSFGKNVIFQREEKGQLSFYAIGGFPTRLRVTPCERTESLLGTRFFSVGAGVECSYSFIKERRRALTAIVQGRFLHFFNRSYFPVLPCNATIQPGNVTDLFMILQYREKQNVFETGYNPTFFTDQAVLLPNKKEQEDHFTRNSFYASVTHLFRKSWVLERPGAIGAGFNISHANLFNTKTNAYWINLSMLF